MRETRRERKHRWIREIGRLKEKKPTWGRLMKISKLCGQLDRDFPYNLDPELREHSCTRAARLLKSERSMAMMNYPYGLFSTPHDRTSPWEDISQHDQTVRENIVGGVIRDELNYLFNCGVIPQRRRPVRYDLIKRLSEYLPTEHWHLKTLRLRDSETHPPYTNPPGCWRWIEKLGGLV